MTKKKETAKSVALFGEEIVEEKKVKKSSSKPTKSSSKSDVKTKSKKLSSEKKSLKKEKEIKKNDTRNSSKSKFSTNSKSNRVSSDSSTNNKRNSSKKKTSEVPVTSKRGSSNSSKERGNSSARSGKDIQISTKSSGANIKTSTRSTKDKGNSGAKDKLAENKSTRLRESNKEPESKSSELRTVEQNTSREEQTTWGNLAELRKEAKKVRKDFKQSDRINAPQTVQWGPNPVKDDFSLVEIIVNGKLRYVSPWSIKDGIYYEGLDSEFLVNCLKYGSEENDKDLEELNIALGTKYKTWEKASSHKKLPENIIMKFGSKLDWPILFKNNDMNKYSKKLKKKYSAEYASAVALD